jgi:citrate lyase subunit beta/citryl-CoA lyase
MISTARAPLFVPADRPERFAKAAASGADLIVIDLEDAVAAANKAVARTGLTASFTPLPTALRINALGTPWHEDDLAVARSGGFAAIVLPKAEDASAIARLALAVPALPIIALIETARGLAEARAIAALDAVERLAFGSVDYCADLNCAHERDVLLPARSELVLASRLGSLPGPWDGVTLALDDPAELDSDIAHARAMGMGGKLCIHPRQIALVLTGFGPTPREIDWAHRILASGDGVAVVDGQMIDEPVRMRARAILASMPAT